MLRDHERAAEAVGELRGRCSVRIAGVGVDERRARRSVGRHPVGKGSQGRDSMKLRGGGPESWRRAVRDCEARDPYRRVDPERGRVEERLFARHGLGNGRMNGLHLAAAGRPSADQWHTIERNDERDHLLRRGERNHLVRDEPSGREILDARIPARDDQDLGRFGSRAQLHVGAHASGPVSSLGSAAPPVARPDVSHSSARRRSPPGAIDARPARTARIEAT